MKLSKLIEKLDILDRSFDNDIDISSVCYDSRKAIAGSLFVAIKGFESDGHNYIDKAAENGCSAVICEVKPNIEIPYVLVSDSRLALALVSCAFYDYPASKMTVIGVTGTSGKTTTTHLIKHVLEVLTGDKVGLVGTNGNYIGNVEIHSEHTTPESNDLQSLFNDMVNAGCKYAVMEVSSHALALNRVAGIHYNVAAYTNLSQDHLDFHKDMDDYAYTKRILFSMCDNACINLDDDYSNVMLSGLNCKTITSSIIDEDANIFADNIDVNSKGVSFDAESLIESGSFTLNIPGKFSVYNALTVISTCSCLGFSFKDIADALSTATGVKGRMESLKIDGDYSVIIDYSHKPDPLEKVLQTLKAVTRGRLVCLFGCGGDRDRVKRPIMGEIAANNSDFVIVTSDNPRTEDPMDIINEILPGVEKYNTPYIVIPDRIEAIRYAVDNALAGDVILLAGKGHEDYQIIGHEKHHMDEREIVADILKERK